MSKPKPNFRTMTQEEKAAAYDRAMSDMHRVQNAMAAVNQVNTTPDDERRMNALRNEQRAIERFLEDLMRSEEGLVRPAQ